jgi:chromosome segregation ATPase
MATSATKSPTPDMSGNMNHLEEATMSHFIKTQIMTVLQPFLDHVEVNDKRISKLEDSLDAESNRLTNTVMQLDTTNSSLNSAVEGLRQTDRRVEVTADALRKCADHMDQMQRGLEFSNEYAERIHNQAQNIASEMPDLKRCVDEVESQLQALQAHFQRLSDSVMANHKMRLDGLSDEMAEVKAQQDQAGQERELQRGELSQQASLLHDMQQEVANNNSAMSAVQASMKEILTREKELSGRLEGWKAQWNKLQPAVDGLKKDMAHQKQTAESHDASIHGLQRGQQTLMGNFDDLQGLHAKMGAEFESLARHLKQTEQALTEAQDNISQNTNFANGLHNRLDQTDAELGKTNLQLKGLEGKHQALFDSVQRQGEVQGEMLQDARKMASEAAAMQRELDKTNDNLGNTAKQLDTTTRNLQTTKGELGNTREQLSQLEGTVASMQSGFMGLQKGFMDSGLEMGPAVAAKRHDRLPRIGTADTTRPSTTPGTAREPRSIAWATGDKADEASSRGLGTPMSFQQPVLTVAR